MMLALRGACKRTGEALVYSLSAIRATIILSKGNESRINDMNRKGKEGDESSVRTGTSSRRKIIGRTQV